MNTRKKAKLVNALDQISDEQEVTINDLVEQLVGVCFSEEEARDLVSFYEDQNE